MSIDLSSVWNAAKSFTKDTSKFIKDNKDTISAIGTLASAWGDYTMANNAAKIEKQKLDYEMNKDAFIKNKMEEQQDNINKGFGDLQFNKKKKKIVPIQESYENI